MRVPPPLHPRYGLLALGELSALLLLLVFLLALLVTARHSGHLLQGTAREATQTKPLLPLAEMGVSFV